MASKQNFNIKDLKCEEVVVFTDRAEVKRSIKVKLSKGENELTFGNVSNFVDRDSFRVNGQGAATVLDVVCQDRRVQLGESNDHEKIKELKTQIESLEKNIKEFEANIQIFDRQQNYLNEFANSLAKFNTSSSDPKEQPKSISKDSISSFMDFLEMYIDKSAKIDKTKFSVRDELKELHNKLNIARDNLNKMNYSNFEQTIECVVLVEAAADDTEVLLNISYLTFSASWIPKYDIRVSSRDNNMIINYYGMISQTTGEDWNETKLSLSTAVPSIGGNVPELDITNVRIKIPPPPAPAPLPVRHMMRAKNMMQNVEYDLAGGAPMAMAAFAAPMQHLEARVETSNVGSTSTFIIPRNSSIPSDNNTHKVTIGIISLTPKFEYATVPKKNTNVYIKAKVTNTSNYALLAGEASIFLENNFVAKTNFKACSPTEEISCSLGVDPAIRVEYKPVNKYKAQTGFINKSTNTSYTQSIEIKNTTKKDVKIVVSDSIPLSNDEKIQVKLLEPDLKTSQNVKLNKSNFLEFDLNIGAGKTEEIAIKYSVEHPVDQEIEFF